jgi:Tol biopolymer transport system component
MVADADGGNIHALMAPGPDWLDWSPDDRTLALMAQNDLYVVDADGASPARKLPISGRVHFPTWLPPDGEEILVRLEAPLPAILAIHPDGTGLRTVSQRLAVNESDYGALAVSPDGTQVSFDQWTRATPQDDPIPRVFVLDLATGTETRLPTPDGTGAQATAVFSPDGLMIAYTRTYPDGTYQAVVAPADGSDIGRALGPRRKGGPDIGLTKAFTPDGTALIARYGSDDAGTTYLLPVDGSAATEVDSGAFDFLDIQRLAP